MPCSAWIEYNYVTEKWQMILDSNLDVIYCDKCPCPKCLQLDFIKIRVRDYEDGPPPVERIREIFVTNGVEEEITVFSWITGTRYEGKLFITVTAPDPVCEQEEWLKICFRWEFDVAPFLEGVGYGGGLCTYEEPVELEEYTGDTLCGNIRVSACGCNDFCTTPAYSGDHIFGNIIIEPGPEALSTSVNFQVFFCYEPCDTIPAEPTLYYTGPDEGGFGVINFVFDDLGV
jgi:hypothetical protein